MPAAVVYSGHSFINLIGYGVGVHMTISNQMCMYTVFYKGPRGHNKCDLSKIGTYRKYLHLTIWMITHLPQSISQTYLSKGMDVQCMGG